eukprot:symbB.v1.2.004297.t1/scaffold220.1/size262620/21
MACYRQHISHWQHLAEAHFGPLRKWQSSKLGLVKPPSWTSTALGGVRGFIRHPVKATGHILGHKMEVIQGSRKRPSYMPPKVPKHPLQDVELNMNEVLTYSDMKLRWQWTTRFSTSRMTIARHWKPMRTEFPRNKPTCAFVWHKDMPHRTPQPELPDPEHFERIKKQELFCVFKSSVYHQHKVTVGDIVQAEKLHRREAGEKVVFGTVLLVGSKDFTILGKPTVPYAKAADSHWRNARLLVQATPQTIQRRQHVTMLRIDEIVLTPDEDPTDPPPPKPVRLLDLWANRWLDPAEKEGIEMVEGEDGQLLRGEDGQLIPKTAEIYDGSEHQPGSYHRRGLTSCYRYWPDPAATHWRL